MVCALLCQHGAPLNALDRKGRRPATDTSSDNIRAMLQWYELRAAGVRLAGAACVLGIGFLVARALIAQLRAHTPPAH